MCVQMYPWQRLHSQKFQMISKLLEGRGGWRSFLVAKRKIELRYWCGETEGILSSSLIPQKIYNSTVSFFFYCVCVQTFCGRSIAVESTPLELTRPLVDHTARAEEDKKQMLVTVRKTSVCCVGLVFCWSTFCHPAD